MLGQLRDAVVGHAEALVAFHLKRLGHHRDGEDAQLARDLGHHRRRAGAGATAHARGDEQHVAALDQLDDAIAILHRRLAADLRIGAGAESLGDVAADLQRGLDLRGLQRLRIGVDADEVHAFDPAGHHVRDGVAAAAAHADDLDHSALAVCVHQFKHLSAP